MKRSSQCHAIGWVLIKRSVHSGISHLKHCDANLMWKILCTRHNYFKNRVSDLCVPLWNCLKIRCLLHWAIQRKTSRMNTSLSPFCLPVWSTDSLRDSTTLQSIWVSDILSLPWGIWKNDGLTRVESNISDRYREGTGILWTYKICAH